MYSVVNFNINGYHYKFPVIYGTCYDKAINISKLRESTGFITFDPGFKNTGMTKSSISFIDGEKGELLYRGYPIEQIIKKCSFIETSYLILNGELPDTAQLKSFSERIKKFNHLHKEMNQILDHIPNFYHPMGILSSLTYILDAFIDCLQEEDMYIHLLAKLPMLAALTYRKKVGGPPTHPDHHLDYISNLLKMFFSVPNQSYEHNPIIADALNKLLILHADHEQNCSTTTVRLLGSAHAGLFSSISAGMTALWGRLHGGANQAVIEMLEDILKSGGNIKKWIEKAKNKKDPFRLMGFGHRIYKNFDPRAKIAKQVAENVIQELGISDPILELAKNLEENALRDSYFIEKKLYPNIDFYSGIIYQAIGIPKDMFTVMFALGRLPGWMAHWKEMKLNRDPIGRPRQIYIGYKKRNIKK
ncbi:citrate synthase [Blattabacterium sp. (Blaberus giganteus)]|uniref:citrate synthase n=1 Tax=Blattabacterium sp. (Blaberus giganteus) TaxID=1186051 RepID=UPI00025F6E5A|nr:citrate synthase [Blattabacterium sp. (Blaberus giganteus)]AFJ90553.1 citrate synthase [Blattabacterium sp. (Blaberus giganteus)]